MSSWWSHALVYQIYPRSFQDSNDDGIGDINGIRRRLPYLSELGVNTIWLSPVYSSPQIDFGYDISDYMGIDPIFGSKDEMRALINESDQLNIRIIMDGVFNHTSVKHPWFLESIRPDSEKHEWYHWAKNPPNNWGSVFGGSGWTLHNDNGKYYLSTFDSKQADLNWSNPDVRSAVLEIMKFWYEEGVSGFRLDVFNCYAKDTDYRNNPPHTSWWRRFAGLFYPYVGQAHVYDRDILELNGYLSEMRQLADNYDAVLLGETLDEEFKYAKAGSYVHSKGLHGAFNFRLLHSSWDPLSFRSAIEDWLTQLDSVSVPVWVMSNHDFPRLGTRWGEKRIRAALTILFMLPGVPVLYNGDELGMLDGQIKRSEIVDPPGKKFWPVYKGRDGCRTPLPWNGSENSGFSGVRPWLPISEKNRRRNVKKQKSNPESVLTLTQTLLGLRRANPELSDIKFCWLDGPRGGLFFSRVASTGEWRVFINMSRRALASPCHGTCLISGQEIKPNQKIPANDAVVLYSSQTPPLSD